ncbi:MAG TPA: Stk1 family PASTA domain-containing Ser/Thr kinase [Propionibacteriaceae bacterium]|nr:Stk1 family PASTA domain-containing Ser/Thr kinase [Propionibacteriaceae bacterium]
MTEQSPLLGDRYRLERVIGRGGMAEVWRAADTRLGRPVAIKRLRVDLATDPTFQARFRREAQAAAGLNHPNIVSVYDTGEETDKATGVAVPYIVMELVDGHTLKEVLRDDRRILPERALEFTQGVLDALSYSHRAGIVHRDIKPANVMLTPNGAVKVMDFGIARAVADTSATMTQTAAVIGTAQYLSPEQARGETVDARSDIYSAGCLLYELLVGRPPFIGDSPVSVAYQHVREVPTPPSTLDPEISQAMDAVVMKALAKDPADRYQSARAMRDDISRLLAGVPVAAPPPLPVPDAAPTVATSVLPAAAAGAAAVALDNPTGTQVITRRVETEPLPGRRRRPSAATVILGLLLAALIGVLAYALYEFNRPSAPTSVQVPGVIGYTQQQAEQQLNDRNLTPVVQSTNGPAGSQGQVVKQDPTAQATVTPGSDVTITVNLGPKTAQIPTGLKGLSSSEATKKLQDVGFKVSQQKAATESPTDKKGTVVQVSPDEGATAAVGSTVTIYVATGLSSVPNLSGLSVADAKTYANDQGFTNVVVAGEKVTTQAAPGTIVSQDPQQGVMAVRTDPIKVYVAKAPSTPSATATAPTSAASQSSAPTSASASATP